MSGEKNEHTLDPSPDEGMVQRLLRKLGKLIPETAEDVACAEEIIGCEPVALPEELLDPSAVFGGSLQVSPSKLSRRSEPSIDPQVLGGFAAAAREGGVISPEIEEKMRRDWESVRKHQDNENNEAHDDGA